MIFWSIFAVKTSPATVANADIRSLKSVHTFLEVCFQHMLVKFEQNRMVQTTRNVEPFDKKKKTKHFFKTIFDKALAPFWNTFV